MFWHLYKYRLRTLSRNRFLLFWSCAFPIVLGLFFNAAFSGLDSTDMLKETRVAVVDTSSSSTVSTDREENFSKALAELTSGKTTLFKPEKVSEAEAAKLLNEKKISGIYFIDDDTIRLKITVQGIEQTILKSFLDQYLQSEQLVKDAVASGQSITPQLLEQLSIQTNHVQENKNSRRGSQKSFYFFSLVGMACMYGFFWGVRNSTDEQADTSPNGIRLSIAPQNKLLVIISSIAASFTLFSVVIVVVLLFFRYVYQVDFGSRWPYILLTCMLGSLNAIAFGTFLGNRLKGSFSQKISIGVSLSMIMSVLAGMTGTSGLKYFISTHLPLLGMINPVNLISESLYQLYYYQTLHAYFLNLACLAAMTACFTILCFLFERRAQYDHI